MIMKKKRKIKLICFLRNRILIVIIGVLMINNGFLLCENNFLGNPLKSSEILLGKSIDIENINKRNAYLKDFEDIDKKVNELMNGNTEKTQSDMSKSAYKAYILWDCELNKIYIDLKENLTEEEYIKLHDEELKWISYKEETSKENAKKYQGGSAYNFVLNVSLAQITRERCYYLVNFYM